MLEYPDEQDIGNGIGPQLVFVLKQAEDFHGHLGPFLVIGVRAGLVGLEKLKTGRSDQSLSTTVMLEYFVPFSCVVDGVQITTGCTIGNKRLTLEDSSGIAVRLKKNGVNVEIAVNSVTLGKLKKQLAVGNVRTDQAIKLAYAVASMEESDLFKMREITRNC